jgi:hypothetical protein
MTARQVHAVIAAGVENPLLVARWEQEPERLAAQGIDPATVDLDALAKFAGLTVKVRHNGLRNDLPLTFRLLNVAGLEIEVFAAYAAFRAEHGGRFAATTEERTRDLIAFLGEWLDQSRREHVLLWDLIRHEHALARLQEAGARPSRPQDPGAGTPERASGGTPALRQPFRIRGQVILHEMQCDPAMVAAMLRASRPALDSVPFAARNVAYWRAEGANAISILELDDFGYCALSLIDGTRSAADLSAALTGRRRPSRAFLHLLGQLGEAGILGI